MNTVQASNITSNNTAAYTFLSKPPPPRKLKVPIGPLPDIPRVPSTRRRSFSAIVAWASNVQPGSPGTPRSPRRPSISISNGAPVISLSPLQKDFTPSTEDFPVNLASLGYTSVFVELPKVHVTTAGPSKPKSLQKTVLSSPPWGPRRSGTMKRLRSLSFLRSRSASFAASPLSPGSDQSPIASPSTADSPEIIAASIVKRKKASYTYAKPSRSNVPPPPSLSQEIALMQFMDGGDMEDNVKKAMQIRAHSQAVGDVYRDGKGGIWADREEEMEYVHLLSGNTKGDHSKWITFRKGSHVESDGGTLAIDSLPIDRRGSATSQTSMLDPTSIVKPAEDEAMVSIPLPGPVLAVSPPASPSTEQSCLNVAPRVPLLSLPCRPKSGIRHHLHGRATYFHLDPKAFSVPTSPGTTSSPAHRAPPADAGAQANTLPAPASVGTSRRRQVCKPAPLTLTTVEKGRPDGLHNVELEIDPLTAVDLDAIRREFLDDSFAPEVPAETSREEGSVKGPSNEAEPLRSIRKSISMKFGGLLGRK